MCKTACKNRDTLPDFKWCCNHVWPMMLNFARDMPELLKPRMSILPLISQISLRSTEFRKWWLLRVVVCIFLNQTQLSVCDILTEASGNVEKKMVGAVSVDASRRTMRPWLVRPNMLRGSRKFQLLDPTSLVFGLQQNSRFFVERQMCNYTLTCASSDWCFTISPCFTKGSVASLGSLLQSLYQDDSDLAVLAVYGLLILVATHSGYVWFGMNIGSLSWKQSLWPERPANW